MQFKYPELLWALFLLLIPIFIHLFQLRRFKKTPFTNVKFLKKVVVESRRSNVLKKWLLLITRLLLLAAMVIAFAQPFFAKKQALKEKETVIYLDDSFSMQLTSEGAPILQSAVQQLIKSIPKNQKFSLFTNKSTYRNVSIEQLQNDLLSLAFTNKQLGLNEIYLKANTLFSSDDSTQKNLILVSDFQQRMGDNEINIVDDGKVNLVRLTSESTANVSIDSVYIKSIADNRLDLSASLSTSTDLKSIPVSLYNDTTLTAKTSAKFDGNKKGEVNFTISNNESFRGKIEVIDQGLKYDNHLYFSIGEKEKIRVLAIGPSNSDYLERIFSQEEFQFSTTTLRQLNYREIEEQHLIILNELPTMPSSLATSIKAFVQTGGHFVVIPSAEIETNTYHLLTANFGVTYGAAASTEKMITHISFEHPLYENVFEKNISNFQYPKATKHFALQSTAASALSFQDQSPFLVSGANFHFFTAPISGDFSNFRNSPLIVPTFYNMALNSLKTPQLYNLLGESNTVDIPIQLSSDAILKIAKKDYEMIPQQQSLTNKVSLNFNDEIDVDGIFDIIDQDNIINQISFNFDRAESNLNYLNYNEIEASTHSESIATLFESMEKDNRVTELWKWFIILALILLMVEILLQKYLK
ncbi:BatA domain-containing protein [Pseudozobellia sp. WGM2]|uniref:BatA domain-containing protein n=1 Tax=Pseudozobellia sp. WGM2 TaxID=2787625 RepID=UPI001ADED02E|nr:BatA domain-containing protein [Pseudozobellia sp. WGM2]